MPNAALLQLAEILDRAGFAELEVSGGGVFDSAVRRGLESPWERIRAINARTKTPLGLALRGRFLVGSQPVASDFVPRFVASAAENGVEIFRLHDPLNDVSNLREAGEAITAAGREFDAGLIYSPGVTGGTEHLVEQARKLPDLGASRILLHDASGALTPPRAHELVSAIKEASGLPVGMYGQGASGEALATSLKGLDLDPGVDVDILWEAAELIDEYIGVEPMSQLPPRISVRAAQHKLPAGLVAAIDTRLRAHGSADRLDEVLDELIRVRSETGSPPLAAPIGQILASQALINVLAATRYQTIVDELRALLRGEFGTPPGPIDTAVLRAIELLGEDEPAEETAENLEELREDAQGLASSEEELLLLALFGEEAEPLLRNIRDRAGGEETMVGGGVDQSRAERIREIVRIVQESGVAEIALEEAGTRVSVRRTEEAPLPAQPPAPAPAVPAEGGSAAAAPEAPPSPDGYVRVDAPMVGTFYRAPQPGAAPFVEEGDAVAPGQTLCILEAMKLMNEVKSELEGIVRRIHVGNAEPVEFGQPLFELEPLNGRPLDAL